MPADRTQYFLNMEQALSSTFKASGVLDSCTSLGRARESILAEFFRKHLPSRLSVERGGLCDASGQRAGELDVMFVDQRTSAMRLGGESLVPVEACPGVVEVKTSLAGGELADAVRKIARVKRMRRVAHNGLYRMSDRQPRIPVPPVAPQGYIVAFSAPAWLTILENLVANPSWYDGDFLKYGPEVIAVVGRGYVAKNDHHFFMTDEPHTLLARREDASGLRHICDDQEEYGNRYGSLTYSMGAYP